MENKKIKCVMCEDYFKEDEINILRLCKKCNLEKFKQVLKDIDEKGKTCPICGEKFINDKYKHCSLDCWITEKNKNITY